MSIHNKGALIQTARKGEIIKQIREEKKLSQRIICQGLCTKSTLSKIDENSYICTYTSNGTRHIGFLKQIP